MAGVREQTNGSPMAEINITPFTDVLLVLLIIFMILASLTVPPGFQKQLHHPSKATRADHFSRPIEVAIRANNRISIDGTTTNVRDLYRSLAERIAFHSRHRGYSAHINMLADQAASYNTVIKVLDAARAAGDEDVAFITQ